MTDKELIKQEIERRIVQAKEFAERAKGANDDSSKLSWDFVATQNKSLLQFINSLQEQPISEDWEEEMIRWHKEHFGNKRDWGKTSGEYLTRKSQLDLAHHFAEWQKQQMMKDAVDAIVHQGLYSKYVKECDDEALANVLKNHNSGDKVKIIIIKEEK